MKFEQEVCLESVKDIKDARVFLGENLSSDYHVIPPEGQVRDFPHPLSQRAGEVLVARLHDKYGEDTPLTDAWQLQTQVVPDLISDPA
jgi:hypothetical protein